jgi:hypothetical protein
VHIRSKPCPGRLLDGGGTWDGGLPRRTLCRSNLGYPPTRRRSPLRLPHDTVALIIRQPETSQDGDGQDYVVKPPGFVAHGGDAGIVKGGLGKGVWPPRRPSRPIPAARIRLQVNHDHSRVITTSLNRLCRCCRHGEDRNDVRQATAATELSRCRRPPSWWKNRLLLGVRREVALSLPITSMSDACFVFETFKIQTYYECALGYPNSCAS